MPCRSPLDRCCGAQRERADCAGLLRRWGHSSWATPPSSAGNDRDFEIDGGWPVRRIRPRPYENATNNENLFGFAPVFFERDNPANSLKSLISIGQRCNVLFAQRLERRKAGLHGLTQPVGQVSRLRIRIVQGCDVDTAFHGRIVPRRAEWRNLPGHHRPRAQNLPAWKRCTRARVRTISSMIYFNLSA